MFLEYINLNKPSSALNPTSYYADIWVHGGKEVNKQCK